MYGYRTSSTSNCCRFSLPSGPLPRYLVTEQLYRRITDVFHPHPDHCRDAPLPNNFTVRLPTFFILIPTSTEKARYRTRLSSNYRCFHSFIAFTAYFHVCRHITVVSSRIQSNYREYLCFTITVELPPLLLIHVIAAGLFPSRPVPRFLIPDKICHQNSQRFPIPSRPLSRCTVSKQVYR